MFHIIWSLSLRMRSNKWCLMSSMMPLYFLQIWLAIQILQRTRKDQKKLWTCFQSYSRDLINFAKRIEFTRYIQLANVMLLWAIMARLINISVKELLSLMRYIELFRLDLICRILSKSSESQRLTLFIKD